MGVLACWPCCGERRGREIFRLGALSLPRASLKGLYCGVRCAKLALRLASLFLIGPLASPPYTTRFPLCTHGAPIPLAIHLPSLTQLAGGREQLHPAPAAAVPVPGGLPPQHFREGRPQQPPPRVRAGAGGYEGRQPGGDAAERVHVVHEGHARRHSDQPLEGERGVRVDEQTCLVAGCCAPTGARVFRFGSWRSEGGRCANCFCSLLAFLTSPCGKLPYLPYGNLPYLTVTYLTVPHLTSP